MANGVSISLAEAAALIRNAGRMCFFLHVSPDGDSIGSTLGVYHALKSAGKDVVLPLADPIPRVYHFLPGWDTAFTPWQQVQGPFDLAVFLDCGDRSRVGEAEPVVRMCPQVLNIDHHATNTVYGDYNYLDLSAAAVGEVAYNLLQELGLPLTRDIATCLYTSIVTDTGSFKYESTTARTHQIVAELLALGAKPYDVAAAVYENETQTSLKLLGQSLLTLQVAGRLAWLQVDQAMLQATGASEEDTEGIVNYARAIAGVEVGCFFRETAGGAVKVSLRSRGEVDVGAVAVSLGGGGHARAAGITLPGVTLPVATDRVLAALRPLL